MKEASKQYHLSESTFRRVVNELNKYLIPYNITLSLKSELHVKGNKRGIRLFATMLLSQSYGSKEWVFRDISMAEVQQYTALIKSQFTYTDSLVNDVSALYLIAISFLQRKNLKLSFIPKDKKDWLYVEDTAEFQEFF